MRVPLRSSATACCSSACVFITIGPYQATGSSIGLPPTTRKPMAPLPACAAAPAPQLRLLGQHAERLRGAGERARAFEHIGEGVPADFDRQALALAGRDEHV